MPKAPKAPNVSNARFVIGAAQSSQFPDWALPEIAFGGRSNVGKSSLLRVLAGSRRLVRVSRTPGRTREVNFFELKLAQEPCAFVDLPGYGFAKVPGAIRSRWGEALEDYFDHRPQLAALVLLVDARRGPRAEERDLFSHVVEQGYACLPVHTKVDKLPKTKRGNLLAKAQKALGASGKPLSFSALTGEGREQVLHQLTRFAAAWRDAHAAAKAAAAIAGDAVEAAPPAGATDEPTIPATAAPGQLVTARQADLDEIMAIEEQAFPTPWSRQALAEEIDRPWSIFRVVRNDAGQLCAYLNFWVVHDEVHVLNLATHPDQRREGHARALLNTMLVEARRSGCTYIHLEVRRSNHAAQRLYAGLGFERIGERENYYAAEGEDALIYAMELGPPA